MRSSRVAWLGTWTLFGLAWSGAEALAQPVPPVPGQVNPPNGVPVRHRSCLNDQFFIDVPIWANPSWASASTFATQLRTAINNVKQGYWFCQGTACNNVVATVTPLLPSRPSTGQSWRNDGDRRFFRVKFTRGAATFSVLPERICEAVRSIRGVAQAQAGAVPLFVGRECEASALGSLESVPSQEMIDWPKVEMGISGAPPVTDGNVDIALLDSGVDPAVAAAADVRIAEYRSFITGTPPLHAHGTAMALFLRQLAPNARIYDARVLSSHGQGTGQSLAQGIDWALFEKRQSKRPMVLSLSLGWPVHDSKYAWVNGPMGLSGATCSYWEAPFGEPIRYLLTGAQKGELASVVAAAGNDPTTGDVPHVVSTDQPPPPYAQPPACGALSTGSRWLYPARWDEQSSCFTDGVTRYSALGVSAIDARRQVASTGIPRQEALIVAPGEHVYAAHPSAAVNTGAALCTTADEPVGVSLPRVFSGSSVSGAYVAGAVARAQDLWINKTGEALTPDQAQKLVYLTGQTLCRLTDQYVRMVSVPRLEAAIADQSCGAELLSCSSGAELTGYQTYDNCRAALQVCGLDVVGEERCLDTQKGIDWPSSYNQVVCGGEHDTNNGTSQTCAPGGAICPFELLPSTIELGSLGPQPHTGGCPECRLTCGTGTSWKFTAQLSSYFPGGTNGLINPRLAISTMGSSTITWINLTPGLSPAEVWVKGSYVTVKVPSSLIPVASCSSMVGNFWITQTSGSVPVAENFSPLKFVQP